ncbi:hypothetical protein BH11CYA1_BH11CYA1_33750 [soil metagenome]
MFEYAAGQRVNQNLLKGECLSESENAARINKFTELLFRGELHEIEKFVLSIGDRDDSLPQVVKEVARRHANSEFGCAAWRISWREGTIAKSAIVIEFRLARARRSLFLYSAPALRSQVCQLLVGSTVKCSSEDPALLMRQVGRIASISIDCAPPPLFRVD